MDKLIYSDRYLVVLVGLLGVVAFTLFIAVLGYGLFALVKAHRNK